MALCLVTVLAIAVISLASLPRLRTMKRPTLALGCLFASQLFFKLLELFARPSEEMGVVLAALNVMLYAAAFFVLTCVWSLWASTLGGRVCSTVSVVSFVLSFFVRAFTSLFSEADAAVMASLPALSAACAWFVLKRSNPSPTSDKSPNCTPNKDEGGPYSLTTWKQLTACLHGTTGVLSLFLIISAIARSVAFGPLDGSLLSPQVVPKDWLTIALACVILAYCWLNAPVRRISRTVLPFAMVIMFAGLFLMAYADSGIVDAGKQIMIVGRTELGLLFWLILCDGSRDKQEGALVTLAAPFALTDAVSSLFGYVVVPSLLDAMGIEPAATTTLLAASATFILVVISIVFFTRAMDRSDAPDAETDNATSQFPQIQAQSHAPYDALFADALLTEREEQVAILIAEGNSQKKISELIGVSVGTVQTHIKAVYRKLGIHSRQELIDLVHGQSSKLRTLPAEKSSPRS